MNFRRLNFFVILLVAAFFLIHADLLLFGTVRLGHDIFATYSNFYYAVNNIANGTLPLWDPYTHAGQPYYYQFAKAPTGEIGVFVAGLIAALFQPSFLKLYSYYNTAFFLLFVIGCYYLARVLFEKKATAYYVLLVSLFSSQYGILMSSESPILTITFVPWIMAFFILFFRGTAGPHHLFAAVAALLLHVQTTESVVTSYFLLAFCCLFAALNRKNFSVPKLPRSVWILASVLLVAGMMKTGVLLSERGNIFPSMRYFTGTGKVGDDLNVSSPDDQMALAGFSDYLNLLNPVIDLDPVGNGCEFQFYIGIIPVFLAWYAAVAARTRLFWSLAVPGIMSGLVSLGQAGGLSKAFFYILPLFKSVRVMENFGHAPVYISLVFLSAVGFEKILVQTGRRGAQSAPGRSLAKQAALFAFLAGVVTSAYILSEKSSIPALQGELFALAFSFYAVPLSYVALGWYAVRRDAPPRVRTALAATGFAAGAFGCLLALWGLFRSPSSILQASYDALRPFVFGTYFAVIQQYTGGIVLVGLIVAVLGGTLMYLALGARRSSPVFLFVLLCFSATFIDLARTSGMHPYTQYELKTFDVPEEKRPLTYQEHRERTFWPEEILPVYQKPPIHPSIRPFDAIPVYLRPAMLYLRSSVITEPVEYDYYMTRTTWAATMNFPEDLKAIAFGGRAPKLRFIQNYRIRSDDEIFRETPALDAGQFEQFVYLAPWREAPDVREGGFGAGRGGVMVHYFDANRLKAKTDFTSDGILYYSDGYDKYWRGYLDGVEIPVYRADVAFKALHIPRGRHSVELVYRPLPYLVSLALYFLACGLSLLAAAAYFPRRVIPQRGVGLQGEQAL